MSHSDERVDYQSLEWIESTVMPGVRFQVERVSLARRAEIAGRVRDMLREIGYRDVAFTLSEQLCAAQMSARVDELYLRWGLRKVVGLLIDGAEASVDLLVKRGPEALSKEIAATIRARSRLSEAERKN